MKTKYDKKVNSIVKKLNKKLQKDVFQNRFSIRQLEKRGVDFCHNYHIYLYEFLDEKYPERNIQEWFTEAEIIVGYKIHIKINDFIIHSDFWDTFDSKSWSKNKAMCNSCDEYVPYIIKMSKLVAEEITTNEQIIFYGEQAYCKHCHQPVHLIDSEIDNHNKERIKEINPDFNDFYCRVSKI